MAHIQQQPDLIKPIGMQFFYKRHRFGKRAKKISLIHIPIRCLKRQGNACRQLTHKLEKKFIKPLLGRLASVGGIRPACHDDLLGPYVQRKRDLPHVVIVCACSLFFVCRGWKDPFFTKAIACVIVDHLAARSQNTCFLCCALLPTPHPTIKRLNMRALRKCAQGGGVFFLVYDRFGI